MTTTLASNGGSSSVSLVQDQFKLNERRLASIIDKLYRALVWSKGLYSVVKTETHAPQSIYYPGSAKVQPVKKVPSPQQTFSFLESGLGEVVSDNEHVPLAVVGPGTLEHRQWLWFATLTDRRED